MSAREAFHIAGEGIDLAELRARVASNLAARAPLPFDPAPHLAAFDEPAGGDGVERALARLRRLLESPVASDLMKPGRTRLDRVLDRARRPLHALVRYYVDTQAARQEEQLACVLAALEGLRHENEALRAEVARLREANARSGGRGGGGDDVVTEDGSGVPPAAGT